MKKTHLTILILIVVLAFIGFAYFVSIQTNTAQADANKIYERIRDNVATHISDAESLLHSLSKEVDKAELDGKPCEAALSKSLEENSDVYDVFLLVGKNGDLLCTPGGPVSKTINFREREYYARAMATNEFAVGEFLVGKVSNLPVLAVALPVKSQLGEVEYLLVAGLKTSWLENALLEAGSDDNTLLVELQDQSGVLLRYFANGTIAAPGSGRMVELVRLPLMKGFKGAEIVVFQKT